MIEVIQSIAAAVAELWWLGVLVALLLLFLVKGATGDW